MHFGGNSEDDLTTTGDLTTRLGVVNMLSGCYVQCITCPKCSSRGLACGLGVEEWKIPGFLEWSICMCVFTPPFLQRH